MARYALIIGIAEYTNSFKGLETPVNNANAIADILDRHGDFNQVKRLPFRREAGQQDLGKVIRKSLPHEALVRELQQFLQDADGSDVLIYYSGHGFTKLDPLSHTPEGYLAPSDCQVELNTAGKIIAEKNGISLLSLNALINSHTFNSLVIILDCCNSGAFIESGMVRRDVTTFDYQRDYYLITACRSSSKAYEGEDYSLLTNAVLKGLSLINASPRSGRISGDRLFDVIGNELQNSRQEPIRLGWGRMITLVRYPQPPESSEPVADSFNPINPYMGLKPFEREQANYFFGREQAVRALLDRLSQNRFLAVIGPSGSGKSSLVRAGLLSELGSNLIPGSREWQVKIITPGQYPLQALTNALERHPSNDKPIVLFVDQFEELFTLCPHEEEQRTFIKRLTEETNAPSNQTRIVIAMRGDFLDRCAKFQESADLINSTAPTTYIVIPLTEAKLVANLEESITGPAELHGVQFEPGLVSRILDDVINQMGAMPLLQYALMRLWDSCISPNGVSRLLTLQSYDAIEGVKGALQHWADQFYTGLSVSDQAFVRELVGELVQIGDSGEVTRRRASWERLREIAASQKQLDSIIGRLVYQRLLVADDKAVEVAHEALLSESRLIQGWIEENWESIRLQQRLEIYCREWQEHEFSENYLLDAGRLAAINEWIDKQQPRLIGIDQEFIEKSRERRDRQFQIQLEQERRLREEAERRELAEIEKKLEAEARAEAETARVKESEIRVQVQKQKNAWSLAAIVLLTGVTILSFNLRRELEQRERIAIEASFIGPQQLFQNGQQLESLIAITKVLKRIKGTPEPVPKSLQSVFSSIQEINRLEGHSGEVMDVSYSSDGQIIASSGRDNTIRIWSKNGQILEILNHNSEYGVWDISFSQNDDLIASADGYGKVRIWSTNKWDYKELKFEGLEEADYATAVSFNLDSSLLATAITNDNYTSSVIIWNIKNQEQVSSFTLFGKNTRIFTLSFDPDSNLLVVCDTEGTISLWDVNGRELIRSWVGHKGLIQQVAFNSDGSLFATTGGLDNLVKIWRAKDGSLKQTLKGHKDKANGVAFSPVEAMVASSSKDETIILWSLVDGKAIKILKGHSDAINGISFSKDGKTLVSASDDGSVRQWIIDPPSRSSYSGFDSLASHTCEILRNYLKYNENLSPEDSKVCDGI